MQRVTLLMSAKFPICLKNLFQVRGALVNSVDCQFQNDLARNAPASVHTWLMEYDRGYNATEIIL